jgi:hypothetical protein
VGLARQCEAIVQRRLESFWFREGLFPISHCAIGGHTDTLGFSDAGQWLEGELRAADDSGQRPLLIELKQTAVFETAEFEAMASEKSEVAEARGVAVAPSEHRSLKPAGPTIVALVTEALAQCQVYAEALKANERWSTLRPRIVVVYGGSERYAPSPSEDWETPSVHLIYVGSAPPSRARPLALRL